MIIGLDVGGTNIDAVIIKNREIISKVKKPHKKHSLLESILEVIDELLKGYDKSQIKRINLSTTVTTNALIKEETEKVGMIIQSGPGLNIESLACGDELSFIEGSIDHRGRVVKDLILEEIRNTIEDFKDKGIETCGLVGKFSTRNSSHEKVLEEMCEKDFKFTTTGHSLSGKLNFPRRIHTAYLNSAVHTSFNGFAKDIRSSLALRDIEAPIYILKADGGTMDLGSAESKPVETILSGPTASFMGINALLAKNSDGIFIDIGGTTTDIFFIVDGLPVFEPLGISIDKYKTLVRSIYSVSIGLGGDSHAYVKDGKIKIESKANIDYGDKQSPKISPTDAMVRLGLIKNEDKFKADEKMKSLGRDLSFSADETAREILDKMASIIKDKADDILKSLNSKPVYTVKEVLHGRVIKPEFINIIGGPARNLAGVLEEKFELPCYYPKDYHVANAIGAALAKPTMDLTLIADTERKIVSIPELSIYKEIKSTYDLEDAKDQACELLKEHMKKNDKDSQVKDEDIEIIYASSFNMVDGFYTTGKNIRVEAQIKPGLIYKLRSGNDD